MQVPAAEHGSVDLAVVEPELVRTQRDLDAARLRGRDLCGDAVNPGDWNTHR